MSNWHIHQNFRWEISRHEYGLFRDAPDGFNIWSPTFQLRIDWCEATFRFSLAKDGEQKRIFLHQIQASTGLLMQYARAQVGPQTPLADSPQNFRLKYRLPLPNTTGIYESKVHRFNGSYEMELGGSHVPLFTDQDEDKVLDFKFSFQFFGRAKLD